MDCRTGYSKVNIGKNFSIVSGNFFIDYNTELTIGDDCMFSADIWLRTSDAHLVFHQNKYLGQFDIRKKHCLNIGNHCWIGLKSMILKNTSLPNGTIVGSGAVVTKKFDIPSCAIGGNPAKIIKQDMTWDREPNFSYIKRHNFPQKG